ncbi:hypothetical protein CTAYLR_005304 [Chrysophaeum taylorii]|uniref:Calcineurin-like phosphoesterase domain-containing protein n=1 Tax=Chrysophaeum taylorii TaxID=2483200 RepID=A0AAD7XNB9_9STRA|nr:hypothetical protein CTAYLR_005304 [Chrysophaeum taylorii]
MTLSSAGWSPWVALMVVGSLYVFGGSRAKRSLSSGRAQCEALAGAAELPGRMVVIGDLHGDRDALVEILVAAGVSDASCEWRGGQDAVVVQLGDVVDRGPDSEGANACLRRLQASAPGAVFRLAGNHEVIWAEGDFRFASRTETPAVRSRLIRMWLDEVSAGNVVGAYAAGPVLFTHAGFRPAMLAKVSPDPFAQNPASVAASLARLVNSELRSAVEKCSGIRCAFEGDLFSAGRDRGGNGVGGTFWTDFGILLDADADALPAGLVQVVGHSAARCSARASPKCEPIRARQDLAAVCVDAGLSVAYASNRAYLEIRNGTLVTLTRTVGGAWRERDLTAEACASDNNPPDSDGRSPPLQDAL